MVELGLIALIAKAIEIKGMRRWFVGLEIWLHRLVENGEFSLDRIQINSSPNALPFCCSFCDVKSFIPVFLAAQNDKKARNRRSYGRHDERE